MALGIDNNAWNVVRSGATVFVLTTLLTKKKIRSEFDQLLLEHARSSGASIYEQTRVTAIVCDDTGRPTAVNWSQVSTQRIQITNISLLLYFSLRTREKMSRP